MQFPSSFLFGQRRVRFSRRVARTSALLVIGATSFCVQVQAQPEGESLMVPEDAVTADVVAAEPRETPVQKAARLDVQAEERDRVLWREARQKIGGQDNERQKPAETQAAYQGWLQSHPTLHPTVVAEAVVVRARIQMASGDQDSAKATLNALWDKSGQTLGGLVVRAAQAQMKLDGASPDDKAKAGQEAQTMLEPLLDRAIDASHQLEALRFLPGREVLWRYADALSAQDKGLEAGAFATKVMLGAPEHLAGSLQNEGGWLYRTTVETLLADARPEAAAQALSWAKLSWVERGFDTRAVKETSALVAQALLAQPKGSELLSQWAKAQKDPSVANPLQKVALPLTGAKALPQLLERLGAGRKWEEERVGVLLWMGRNREAMDAALEGADKLPPDAKEQRLHVMRQVARVFKAHDLNLKRANAYLGWTAKPVGENPLDVFLAQVPAGATP